MTPARVQFSRGPRKYEIPLLSTSLSILTLLSVTECIACAKRNGAIFRRVFGRVALYDVNQAFSPHTVTAAACTYRRIVSSIPSLPGSNRALLHEVNAAGSSPVSESARTFIPAVRKNPGSSCLSPTLNASDPS